MQVLHRNFAFRVSAQCFQRKRGRAAKPPPQHRESKKTQPRCLPSASSASLASPKKAPPSDGDHEGLGIPTASKKKGPVAFGGTGPKLLPDLDANSGSRF